MEIKKDKSFGIIPVFKDAKGDFIFCLVRHAGEHWGFPKGHPETRESEIETARRELKEETGIDNVNLSSQSFSEKYSFVKDNFQHNKTVKYFLGFVSSMTSKIPDDFRACWIDRANLGLAVEKSIWLVEIRGLGYVRRKEPCKGFRGTTRHRGQPVPCPWRARYLQSLWQ